MRACATPFSSASAVSSTLGRGSPATRQPEDSKQQYCSQIWLLTGTCWPTQLAASWTASCTRPELVRALHAVIAKAVQQLSGCWFPGSSYTESTEASKCSAAPACVQTAFAAVHIVQHGPSAHQQSAERMWCTTEVEGKPCRLQQHRTRFRLRVLLRSRATCRWLLLRLQPVQMRLTIPVERPRCDACMLLTP